MKASWFLFILVLHLSPMSLADDVSYYSYKYSKSDPVHIDGEELGTCFGILAFNYHGPSTMDSSRMNLPYDSSDFKRYLTASSTRMKDFNTGEELNLRDWILNQKDNSITPFSLFQHSLKIHKGNSWNAILAIHEVLRDHARYFSKKDYRFEYEISAKNSSDLFNKLVDIRGDLKEKGGSDNLGDHRGSWYRFWGMMLYQVKSNPRLFNRKTNCIQPESTMKNIEASAAEIQGHLVARGAEWVKHLMDDERPTEDKRKSEYNLIGVSSMKAMDAYLKNPFSSKEDPSQILKRCQQSHYIKKGLPE